MTYEKLKLETQGAIRIVTLSDPATMNAASVEMAEELTDALGKATADPEVRAIVLTGEGRGFCSGGDVEEIIAELLKLEVKELLEFTRKIGRAHV